MEETAILYRPVGNEELELIRRSDFRKFPPRLPEQPIFYPVLHEEYAIQIARDWNAKHFTSHSKASYIAGLTQDRAKGFEW